MTLSLYQKYSNPAPRYTYTPTTKFWNSHDLERPIDWSKNKQAVDIYIHLPFCPKLCTFCGCNIKITSNLDEIASYIQSLIDHWTRIQQDASDKLLINSIHFGGGTPNHVPTNLLNKLIHAIINQSSQSSQFYMTTEADPRLQIDEFLSLLRNYNLKRISFGVQDTNEKVLLNVNRPQSFIEIEKNINKAAKNAEVSLDMIYGLPFQDVKGITKSLTDITRLEIKGISFYPLAQVPWQQKSQSSYGQFYNMPIDQKVLLFYEGRKILEEKDFIHLGFGHFVKDNSALYHSFQKNQLKRTPMGYTHLRSKNLLPLGVSSIGYFNDLLIQNHRILADYQNDLNYKAPQLILRHHLQSKTQQRLMTLFEKISTQSLIEISTYRDFFKDEEIISELDVYQKEKLIQINQNELIITELGRDFLKNLCTTFNKADEALR